jgi:hypothetical protein
MPLRFLLALTLATLAIIPPLNANPGVEPEWETRLMLPPLVTSQRAEDATRGSVLWPFFHWERVGTNLEWGLRPLFGWERNVTENRVKFDILWPAFRYDRDQEELDWNFLLMAGGWQVNREWGDPDRYFGIIPLMWFQRDPMHSLTYVFPFLSLREAEEGGQVRFDALLPFFRSIDERNEEETRCLFPVIWRHEHGELVEFDVFPLYWHRWADTPRRLWIFPLWGSRADVDHTGAVREHSRFLLWPLWVRSEWNSGRQWRRNILWPLIAWGSGRDGESIVRVLPFFSSQSYTQSASSDYRSHDLFVFPLWLIRHYEGEEMIERNLYLPPYWRVWGPDFADRRRSSWGIYPLINGGADENEGRHISLFDPLFFLRDREFHQRFAPLYRLFHHTRSPDGEEVSTELLWRIFHRQRRGEAVTTRLLGRVFEFNRSPEGNSMRLLFSPEIPLGGGNGSNNGS